MISTLNHNGVPS